MTTGMRYFLAVAQERNISRAAKKLYVSQQSLSEQLKRLEAQYDTTLFVRKPHFALTASGEALLKTLQQIQILENGLSTRLEEIKDIGVGTLRVGIHSARARVFLPAVIGRFHQRFPRVKLSFVHADTAEFERMLLAGQVDLFLGIDTHPHSEFQSIALGYEPIYMVVSQKLLEQYLGTNRISRISADDLKKLPLIMSPPSSNLQREVDRFLENTGTTPNSIVTIADFETQMMTAGQDIAACFCPKQLLYKLNDLNIGRQENLLFCCLVA